MTVLTFDDILTAVRNEADFIRMEMSATAAGQTLAPAIMADGQPVEYKDSTGRTCTLLNSVAAEANRVEAALLQLTESGRVSMPLVAVEFAGGERIFDLEAPNRIFDSYFVNAMVQEGGVAKPFRTSDIGAELFHLGRTGAGLDVRSLFHHCPAVLVFGGWDSLGRADTKIARMLHGEMHAIGTSRAVLPGNRLDPFNLVGDGAYRDASGQITFSKDEAVAKPKSKSKLKGKTKSAGDEGAGSGAPKLMKLSEHGVGSALSLKKVAVVAESIRYDVLLSLSALRMLDFRGWNDEQCAAAHAALVCLAVCGLAKARSRSMIRSGCQLSFGQPVWTVSSAGEISSYELSSGPPVEHLRAAIQLHLRSLEHLSQVGIMWRQGGPLTLRPTATMQELVDCRPGR